MNTLSRTPHFGRQKLRHPNSVHLPKAANQSSSRLRCRAQAGGKSDPQNPDQKKLEGLPLSLYTPFHGLPPEGKTLTEGEETCNPEERNCKTPAYVYEGECSMCNGTGVAMTKSKGKRRACTCTLCNGLGYVRRTTCRFIPDVNCVGPNLTINRDNMQDLQNGVFRLKIPDKFTDKE